MSRLTYQLSPGDFLYFCNFFTYTHLTWIECLSENDSFGTKCKMFIYDFYVDKLFGLDITLVKIWFSAYKSPRRWSSNHFSLTLDPIFQSHYVEFFIYFGISKFCNIFQHLIFRRIGIQLLETDFQSESLDEEELLLELEDDCPPCFLAFFFPL